MRRTPITICTEDTSKDRDLVSNGPKIHHPQSGATNAGNAAEATEANVNEVHLHPVVEEAATVSALVALAGVAGVIGMVVGRREMVEGMSAGSEAGLPRREIIGGAFLLIGGGMIEPELLLWMTA